jgi:outer membrane immunogenic protein
MKKLLFATVASLLTLSAAQAADIVEPPAVYDWTGPYIGLQGGYAWGGGDVDQTDKSDPDIVGVNVDSLDGGGFVGGLHAGYLMQSDNLVFGVEGDIEYADIRDDATVEVLPPPVQPNLGSLERDIDWLGSLRLRAGFAMDRALIYATGGLAVGGANLDADLSPAAASSSVTTDLNDGTQWGWTIGGGIEYALTDELSARIEYRYTDLGKTDVKYTQEPFSFKEEVENDFHAVRAGLSWHFH